MQTVKNSIDQHLPHLNRYAIHLAGTKHGAEDLVQDCATRAIEKAHLFHDGTNMRAWLSTIMRNLYFSEHRRRSRAGVSVDIDDVADALAVRPRQLDHMTLHDVDGALRALPSEQRTALLLAVVEEMPYEEIAARLDIPIGTVKSRIARAREFLRERLDETGYRTGGTSAEAKPRAA